MAVTVSVAVAMAMALTVAVAMAVAVTVAVAVAVAMVAPVAVSPRGRCSRRHRKNGHASGKTWDWLRIAVSCMWDVVCGSHGDDSSDGSQKWSAMLEQIFNE